jgi:hypothetical protein
LDHRRRSAAGATLQLTSPLFVALVLLALVSWALYAVLIIGERLRDVRERRWKARYDSDPAFREAEQRRWRETLTEQSRQLRKIEQ